MEQSDSLVISKKKLALIVTAIIYLFISMSVFLLHPNSSEQGLKYLGVFHPILFLVTIGFIISDYLRKGHWFNLTNFNRSLFTFVNFEIEFDLVTIATPIFPNLKKG